MRGAKAGIAATLLVLVALLAACRPLYLPPLIDAQEPESRSRLALELELAQGRPVLLVEVFSVATPGWLAVQWFAPRGGEVASQSVWLEADSVGLKFRLPLPEDVEVVPGEWRALLSQHSLVVRQLNITVP